MRALTLENVRSYDALELEPAAGLNVFVGGNAQGKSNVLEAIGMLATARSFRTARDGELVKNGTTRATIVGEAQLGAAVVRLACAIVAEPRGVRKRYGVNGADVRYASFLGHARVVTFAPEDVQIVTSSPSLRRGFLNASLAQEHPGYYGALAAYVRALAQKNAHLRGTPGAPDQTLLDAYDEQLVRSGGIIVAERARFIDELGALVGDTYADIAHAGDSARLSVQYRANAEPSRDVATARAHLAEKLQTQRRVEIARRVGVVGPHRDDLEITLGGRALSIFGSQGERRTAVLALKMAEHAVRTARSGEQPLLLLDDVLSELDGERQTAFLGRVRAVEQSFVTTTGPYRDVADALFTVADSRVVRR